MLAELFSLDPKFSEPELIELGFGKTSKGFWTCAVHSDRSD